jgi:hypothetical protein
MHFDPSSDPNPAMHRPPLPDLLTTAVVGGRARTRMCPLSR